MSARLALNVNFSVFRERGAALGWMLPDVTPAIEDILRGDTATEEEVAEEPPSVPDAAQLFLTRSNAGSRVGPEPRR